MPFPQQILTVTDIASHYDDISSDLSFHLSYHLQPVEACPIGFNAVLDGTTCSDINECELPDFGQKCQHSCENLIGSYQCICNPGYKQSENSLFECVDVDECELGIHNCFGLKPKCVNLKGSFKCEPKCLKGFEVDETGEKCVDIDECELNIDGCSQKCVNV